MRLILAAALCSGSLYAQSATSLFTEFFDSPTATGAWTISNFGILQGSGAAATATISGGGLASVTSTANGINYQSPYIAVTLNPTGGCTGYSITANVVSGGVTSYTIVTPGTGCTSTPTVVITAGGATPNSARWYTGSEVPGMHVAGDNNSTGGATGGAQAVASVAAGNSPFNISTDLYTTAVSFASGQFNGSILSLSTAVPGSMSASDSSIVLGAMNGGPLAQMLSGEVRNLAGPRLSDAYNWNQAGVTLTPGTYYAPFDSTTGTICSGSCEATVQTVLPSADAFFHGYSLLSAAPGTGASLVYTLRINGVSTAITFTISGASAVSSFSSSSIAVSAAQGALVDWQIVVTGTISGTRDMLITTSWNGGQQNNCSSWWPIGVQSPGTGTDPYQHIRMQMIRDASSNITFNIYYADFSTTLPVYTQTFRIPTGHQSDNYQYLTLSTVNGIVGIHQVNTQWTDIVGQFGITGTPYSITGLTPSGGSTTIQNGNTLTVNGTGFSNSLTYTARVGQGSTVSTGVAMTYVSATALTMTVPSQTVDNIYMIHVQANNLDAEYWPGMYYTAGTVTGIVPFEVPTTPANSADGTVDMYGQGFDATSTVTIGGNAASVTYVSPTHLTVVVPSGTQGSPTIVVTANSGATTIYNTATSSTYPVQGQFLGQAAVKARINFGYASHPYEQYTAGASAITSLPTIQGYWTNPNYANLVAAFTADQIEDPPYLWDIYEAILANDSTALSNYYALAGAMVWSPHSPNVGLTYTYNWNTNAGFWQTYQENLPHLVQLYDTYFSSMTPAVRASYEQLFVRGLQLYEWGLNQDNQCLIVGFPATNRSARCSSTAGLLALTLVNSLQSVQGWAQATPWISKVGSAFVTDAATQLDGASANSWTNYTWMQDGAYGEGAQYSQYAGAVYAQFVHARTNMVTLGILGSANGTNNFNCNWANWMASLWDGMQLSTVNDEQPEVSNIALMTHFGVACSNAQLLYMADNFTSQIANSTGLGAVYASHIGNTVTYGGPFTIMWRPSTTFGSSSAFSSWPTVQINPYIQQAALRDAATPFNTKAYLGIKGAANFTGATGGASREIGTNNHWQIGDPGTYTIEFNGEELALDPGYRRPQNAAHSALIIGGTTQVSSTTDVTTMGTSVNTTNWRYVPMNITATYSTSATFAQRGYALYTNGSGKSLMYVLDDLVPSGSATVVSQFQAGKPVTAGASSFTIAGNIGNSATVSYNGPTVSLAALSNAQGANLDPCLYQAPTGDPSWIYCLEEGGGGQNGAGGFGGYQAPWAIGTTYVQNQTAYYTPNGTTYNSLINANVGNTPPTSGSDWQTIGGYTIQWYSVNATYTASQANPMLTIIAPNDGSGALSVSSVNRSTPGTILVTNSDGSTATWTQATVGVSPWLMTSQTGPTMSSGAALVQFGVVLK